MKALCLTAAAALAAAAPAGAQTMDHRMMPGMTMPSAKAAARPRSAPKKKAAARKVPARATKPARAVARRAPDVPEAPDAHAGHDMAGMAMPADPHAGHDGGATPGMDMTGEPATAHDMAAMPGMTAAPAAPAGTDLPPGQAPAPAPRRDLAAGHYYDAAAMQAANRALRREHGGMTYSQVLFNLAEYQARKGRDGYRWDGEAWIGGDIDRLTLKSEGEGAFGTPIERVEVQALYSRAIDPYWNLQAGVRHDVRPGPARTYATVGIEGLAPYWFDVEGALFLSDKGDVLARIEGWYDQRVTQFVVLQPRIEANVAAQAMRANGIGSGLSDLDVGLRLRYDKARAFAPYIGVSWERQFGGTARSSRARGDGTGGFAFVGGVRTWF